MKDTIGLDISKDRLDAFALATATHRSFDNTPAGIAGLIRWIVAQGGPLVVFEPTGRYHARLEQALSRAGLAAHKVNPLHARRFAQATGRLAKTDRIDAGLLAQMGAALALGAQPALSENLHELRELLTAQRSLVVARAAEKARAKATDHAVLKRQIAARIRLFDSQIKALADSIEALVAQDPHLARRVELLASIPGIGRATACAIVIPALRLRFGRSGLTACHWQPVRAALTQSLAACHVHKPPRWQGLHRWRGNPARAVDRPISEVAAPLCARRFTCQRLLPCDAMRPCASRQRVSKPTANPPR